MNLKDKIEELRNELHLSLTSYKSEANKILKLSQELDTLIVEYQKSLLKKKTKYILKNFAEYYKNERVVI